MRATPIAIPYVRPLALAAGTAPEHCAVLVELVDADGFSGWGEIAPGPGTGRAEATAIARRLRRGGRQALAAATAAADAGRAAPQRAALEAALLDLRGRREASPLHRALGAPRAPRQIAVNAMIDRAPYAGLRRAIDEAVADGFRCLKIKAAPHALDDCERALHHARSAHGDAVALRVDCNGQWSVEEARRALRRLEPLALDYVEQPAGTLDELRSLRGATAVRIAADESATDPAAIERAITSGAVDVLVLKPARLGVLACLHAATAARDAGIDCVVTSNLDSSLGIAPAAHLAAAIDARQARRLAHGLGTLPLLAGDLARPGLAPRQGNLTVPQAPGCGVTPLAERIERFTIGRSE